MAVRPSFFRRFAALPLAALALSGLGVAAAGAAHADTAASGSSTIQMIITNNTQQRMQLTGSNTDGTWTRPVDRFLPAFSTAVVTASADHGFAIDLDYDTPNGHAHFHADTINGHSDAWGNADGARVETRVRSFEPNTVVEFMVNR
jgi:hypothetical protein